MDTYIKVGYLDTGEDVYVSNVGKFAKEFDHKYLLELSYEEIENIIYNNDYDSVLKECANILKGIKLQLKTLLDTIKGD